MTKQCEPVPGKSKHVESGKDKPRRDNGEGSVFRRSDTGKWFTSFTDPITGKRRTVTVKSEKAGRAMLREMTTRADNGEIVLDARTPLGEYVEAWATGRAGKRRKPATVGEYLWRLNKYVLPVLGRRPLGDVSVVEVEDLLDSLAERNLSGETLKGVRNALAAVFTDAARARHLRATANPARLAVMPDTTPSALVIPPTTAQVRDLLTATAGTELGRLLAVLAGTGARIGEALAAKWSHIDMEAAVWTVSATMTRDVDLHVVVGDRTKTGRNRTVVLGPATLTVLQEQRREATRMRLASPHWEDHDLVFPSVIGTAQDAGNLRKDMRPIADKVGFAGSFHQLRHFVAAVALSKTGGNDVAVARMLGHARTETTRNVYGHLIDEDAVLISVAIEKHLAG